MDISVVIPVYNEVDALPELYRALTATLDDLLHPRPAAGIGRLQWRASKPLVNVAGYRPGFV